MYLMVNSNICLFGAEADGSQELQASLVDRVCSRTVRVTERKPISIQNPKEGRKERKKEGRKEGEREGGRKVKGRSEVAREKWRKD